MVVCTLAQVLLFITRTGIVMTQTKSGSRIIVIGSTAPAHEKTGDVQPTNQRPTGSRIVVIKNGELVGSRTGR
jgi:hypothetical protein